MSTKVSTYSLEDERALLGSVILDNEALNYVVGVVSPDDFFSQANRLTFEKMIELYEKNRTIDLVTLSEKLAKDGLLEKAGGTAYLAALTDGVPVTTTATIEEYCRIVKAKSTLRRLINASKNTIVHCLEGTDDPESLIDLAQSQVFEIAGQGVKSGFVKLGKIVMTSVGKIDEEIDRGRRATGIETGLEDLDNMTSGFQPGELIVIAARPSLGKTALALNIAAHAAINNRKVVGMFSLEASKESLVTRLLCSEARIDSHKLRNGFSSREDWGRITPVLSRLSEAPLYIDDTPALTIMQIRAKARRLKAEKGLDLLVVDCLQLLSSHIAHENRTQELSFITRGLKGLARELDVPMVLVSQLSDAPEQRQGLCPQLSDLHEFGCVEQVADVIIFLFSQPGAGEAMKGGANYSGTETKLIIAKQRNGPTGVLPVVFLRAFGRFENSRQLGDEMTQLTEETPIANEEKAGVEPEHDSMGAKLSAQTGIQTAPPTLLSEVQRIFIKWLSSRQEPDKLGIYYGGKLYSPAMLVHEIESGTEVGRAHMEMFLDLIKESLGVADD